MDSSSSNGRSRFPTHTRQSFKTIKFNPYQRPVRVQPPPVSQSVRKPLKPAAKPGLIARCIDWLFGNTSCESSPAPTPTPVPTPTLTPPTPTPSPPPPASYPLPPYGQYGQYFRSMDPSTRLFDFPAPRFAPPFPRQFASKSSRSHRPLLGLTSRSPFHHSSRLTTSLSAPSIYNNLPTRKPPTTAHATLDIPLCSSRPLLLPSNHASSLPSMSSYAPLSATSAASARPVTTTFKPTRLVPVPPPSAAANYKKTPMYYRPEKPEGFNALFPNKRPHSEEPDFIDSSKRPMFWDPDFGFTTKERRDELRHEAELKKRQEEGRPFPKNDSERLLELLETGTGPYSSDRFASEKLRQLSNMPQIPVPFPSGSSSTWSLSSKNRSQASSSQDPQSLSAVPPIAPATRKIEADRLERLEQNRGKLRAEVEKRQQYAEFLAWKRKKAIEEARLEERMEREAEARLEERMQRREAEALAEGTSRGPTAGAHTEAEGVVGAKRKATSSPSADSGAPRKRSSRKKIGLLTSSSVMAKVTAGLKSRSQSQASVSEQPGQPLDAPAPEPEGSKDSQPTAQGSKTVASVSQQAGSSQSMTPSQETDPWSALEPVGYKPSRLLRPPIVPPPKFMLSVRNRPAFSTRREARAKVFSAREEDLPVLDEEVESEEMAEQGRRSQQEDQLKKIKLPNSFARGFPSDSETAAGEIQAGPPPATVRVAEKAVQTDEVSLLSRLGPPAAATDAAAPSSSAFSFSQSEPPVASPFSFATGLSSVNGATGTGNHNLSGVAAGESVAQEGSSDPAGSNGSVLENTNQVQGSSVDHREDMVTDGKEGHVVTTTTMSSGSSGMSVEAAPVRRIKVVNLFGGEVGGVGENKAEPKDQQGQNQSNPTGGSLFNFGAVGGYSSTATTASTAAPLFNFGSTATTTAGPSGSLFGAAGSSGPLFGSPAPAATATTAGPSGSLFGGPAPATTVAGSSVSLFGGPVPATNAAGSAGSLFGAPAPATTSAGPTGSPFAPAPATAAGSPGLLFGAPAPAPATTSAGPTGSPFGAPAPATAAGSPGSLFGAPAPPATNAAGSPGSVFGAPVPATTAAGSSGSLFGAPAPATTAAGSTGSLFGAPAPATTAAGSSGSLFGAPAPATAAGSMGSLFGAPAPTTTTAGTSGSLFGGPATATTSSSLFGAPTTTSGTLFGGPAPAPAPATSGLTLSSVPTFSFDQPSATPANPSPSPAGSTGLFGQPTLTTATTGGSGNGNSNSLFGTPGVAASSSPFQFTTTNDSNMGGQSSTLFGGNNQTSAVASEQGSSMFGPTAGAGESLTTGVASGGVGSGGVFGAPSATGVPNTFGAQSASPFGFGTGGSPFVFGGSAGVGTSGAGYPQFGAAAGPSNGGQPEAMSSVSMPSFGAATGGMGGFGGGATGLTGSATVSGFEFGGGPTATAGGDGGMFGAGAGQNVGGTFSFGGAVGGGDGGSGGGVFGCPPGGATGMFGVQEAGSNGVGSMFGGGISNGGGPSSSSFGFSGPSPVASGSSGGMFGGPSMPAVTPGGAPPAAGGFTFNMGSSAERSAGGLGGPLGGGGAGGGGSIGAVRAVRRLPAGRRKR